MAQADGPLSGAALKVYFDSNFIGGVRAWKIDPKVDKKDITAAKASGAVQYKAYLATLKDCTITVELSYVDLVDAGQLDVWNNFQNNEGKKELKLYEDDTHYFFCDAWCESFPISSKVDDVEGAGITITFQMQDEDGLQLPA
jgi:hypothetical protein